MSTNADKMNTEVVVQLGKIPWPLAPGPWRAFALFLIPSEKGVWQRKRLRDLTSEELNWVTKTFVVEYARRLVREEVNALVVIGKQYQCERCQHVWAGREDRKPVRCPKCTSPYWDKPRKEEIAK